MSVFYKVIKFNFNNPIYCADGVLVNIPREISAIKIIREILQTSNNNELREQLITLALQQYNKKYIHGQMGPNTFDCAGLIWFLYNEIFSINISL